MNAVPNFCDFLEFWLEAHAARLGWTQIRLVRDAERGTIAAGYEYQDRLFSVSGWENGCCLDVDVLISSTGSTHIVGIGPCASRELAVERLEAAANWIAPHEQI